MLKPILSAVATLALALSTLGQGSLYLDNSSLLWSLVVDRPGNWYSGTFGMEVWELNGTTIPASINLSPAQGSGVVGYDAMVAAGFVKQASYVGRTTFLPGAFVIGRVDMPFVSPGGSQVVIALAAWNTSDQSWSAMLADANEGTRAGITAFVQRTCDYTVTGGCVPPFVAMTQDLVMVAIPEPSGAAVAGLGGVALFLLRRRRFRWLLRREHGGRGRQEGL